MSGLWDGVSGLWGGSPGLYDGVSGLWSGASGLVNGGSGVAPITDPDVLAYIAAMAPAPSVALAQRINTLILGLKADGTWLLLDWLVLCGRMESAQQARINARFPAQLLNPVVSPTFAAGLGGGWTGNGTTQYHDSAFNPFPGTSLFKQNDAHMGIWLGTDVQNANMSDLGTQVSSINARNATGVQANPNGVPFTAPLSVNTSVGHSLWVRSGAAAHVTFKDGSPMANSNNASIALANFPFAVCARNNGGVIDQFSTRQVQAAHWGAQLSVGQVVAFYARLNNFLNGTTAFSQNFNSSAALTYSDADRLVVRSDGGQRRAVRGRSGHITGKWYAELLPLVASLRFGGIVDGTFNLQGAGGPAGANRCGIQAMDLVAYPNVSVALGQFAAPGDIVRIAWDADAKRYWLKLNSGNWNGNALSDPVTGVGGLSTAGLAGPGYVGATLRPVVNAGVRYRLPGDLGYNIPSGFTEWSS